MSSSTRSRRRTREPAEADASLRRRGLDRDGRPVIGFYNGSVFSAQLARKTDDGWEREQVESEAKAHLRLLP